MRLVVFVALAGVLAGVGLAAITTQSPLAQACTDDAAANCLWDEPTTSRRPPLVTITPPQLHRTCPPGQVDDGTSCVREHAHAGLPRWLLIVIGGVVVGAVVLWLLGYREVVAERRAHEPPPVPPKAPPPEAALPPPDLPAAAATAAPPPTDDAAATVAEVSDHQKLLDELIAEELRRMQDDGS